MSMIEGIAEQVRMGLAENDAVSPDIERVLAIREELKDIARRDKWQLIAVKNLLETNPVTEILSSLGSASVSAASSNAILRQATEGTKSLTADVLVQESDMQQHNITLAFREAETLQSAIGVTAIKVQEAITSLRELGRLIEDQSSAGVVDHLTKAVAERGEHYLQMLGGQGGEPTGGYDQ